MIERIETERLILRKAEERDLEILTRGGYRVDAVQPVDMFPYTEHVEAVILMSRGDR